MTITEKTTVGEVATAVPASIPVFYEYGVDFWCGGAKTLGEACRYRGVPATGVLAKVEQAQHIPWHSEVADWASENLGNLIDHIIEKHHGFLWKDLPRLATILDKLIEADGPKHSDSLRALSGLYTGLQQELEQHMAKEENILFPLIRQMEEAHTGRAMPPGMPVIGPIQAMEMQHKATGNALLQMRQITAGYQAPEDACLTYRTLLQGLESVEVDLHEHLHLENNILFPRALALADS